LKPYCGPKYLNYGRIIKIIFIVKIYQLDSMC